MKFALAMVATAAAFSLSEEESQFEKFILEHGRNYPTREEYEYRFGIFRQRLAHHKQHNANPEATHTIGVNMFSDHTDAEVKMRNGYLGRSDEERNPVEMNL